MLLTRNVTKALSVLMVDFSCALKLVYADICSYRRCAKLSAHGITVKGGKFLEAMAEADTIVFDKTGTTDKSTADVVSDVISFGDEEPDESFKTCRMLGGTFSSFDGKSCCTRGDGQRTCSRRKCIPKWNIS